MGRADNQVKDRGVIERDGSSVPRRRLGDAPGGIASVTSPSRIDAAALGALEEGLVVLDRDGALLRSNPAAANILGANVESTEDPRWRTLLSGSRAGGGGTDVGSHVLATGDSALGVAVEIDRDGRKAVLSANYTPLRGDEGLVEGLVVSFWDITEREAERRDLKDIASRLREAHEVAQLASWERDAETGTVTVFQAIDGSEMAAGTAITMTEWLSIVPSSEHAGIEKDFEAIRTGASDFKVRRFRHVLPSGPAWLEIRSRAVRDRNGQLQCVRGTAQDVTDQEQARQELIESRDFVQSIFDSLATLVVVLDNTGLIVLVNQAWTHFASANGGQPGTAGVGTNYLDACDAASPEHSSAGAAAGLRSIIAGEAKAFSLEYRCDDMVSERWFQLHAIPHRGSGPMKVVITYEDITERKAEERLVAADLDKLAWVARIEDALKNDGFVLHAQPILELASGAITQHELLIRMRPAPGSGIPGLIPPSYFLPVAEEYGLITQIDRWVIDRGCEIAATGLPVQVNVSGRSLADPHVAEHVAAALARTSADPRMVVFEITETALVDNDSDGRAFVAKIRDLGCRVGLDDFGTGYGGFTYLKQLSIDFLKIDMEFVRDVRYNHSSRLVVEAIVKLAQGFSLQTIAEGVEDRATLEMLRELGVDFIQGYFVGRPAPITCEDLQP
jgi:EAL domain-containing protein (putative c-di-GMP-specific phosphodiesterase class I)/PAS domain-containing protein